MTGNGEVLSDLESLWANHVAFEKILSDFWHFLRGFHEKTHYDRAFKFTKKKHIEGNIRIILEIYNLTIVTVPEKKRCTKIQSEKNLAFRLQHYMGFQTQNVEAQTALRPLAEKTRGGGVS